MKLSISRAKWARNGNSDFKDLMASATSAVFNTKIYGKMMKISDNTKIDEPEKEAQFIELLKTIGLDIKFVD